MEERKVNIGGHQRGEAFDAKLNDFVGSLLPNLQQKTATSSVADLVKYNTALLEQIQLRDAKRQKDTKIKVLMRLTDLKICGICGIFQDNHSTEHTSYLSRIPRIYPCNFFWPV